MSNLTAQAIDRAAQSIRAARKAAALLVEASNQLREQLDKVQEETRRVSAEGIINDVETNRQLTRIRDRGDRIRELINMMEAGSFRIQVDHGMEAAWKGLP